MQMKQTAHKRSMLRQLAAVAIASLSTVAFQAHAALPAAATTAFTDLKADAESLITAAWPVVAAITVGFILISLFKRAASKV